MLAADTIVALSSGRLPAGVAVIRASGPQTRFALETMIGKIPEARSAFYGPIRRAEGAVLDSGLVLYFQGPASFTGEDVAEFHVHGGRAVVAAVLDGLVNLAGVRHAEPGEFTKRAFLNGKLDLTETEALADLINAETEAQRRFAVLNAGGAQSDLYLNWRNRLTHARAMIEADIDFSDEEDVPGSVADRVWSDVQSIVAEISDHIKGFHAAEIIRDGFDVVILGAPNAGKSSLLNVLAKRDAAIVTNEPGTTRDLLEVVLDIDGMRVRVTDTAGIRDGAGSVEAIGIERALTKARFADLLLVLEDMRDPIACVVEDNGKPLLRIGTKSDLLDVHSWSGRYDLSVSTKSGKGIGDLINEIGRRAADSIGAVGDVLPSRLRHVKLLKQSLVFLSEALDARGAPEEIRSESLRLASHALGRIAGSVDVEDLLDVIFSQFCIGK